MQTSALLSQCLSHRLGLHTCANDTPTLHTHLLSVTTSTIKLSCIQYDHIYWSFSPLGLVQLVNHARQRVRPTSLHRSHLLLYFTTLSNTPVSFRSRFCPIYNSLTRCAYHMSWHYTASKDSS